LPQQKQQQTPIRKCNRGLLYGRREVKNKKRVHPLFVQKGVGREGWMGSRFKRREKEESPIDSVQD